MTIVASATTRSKDLYKIRRRLVAYAERTGAFYKHLRGACAIAAFAVKDFLNSSSAPYDFPAKVMLGGYGIDWSKQFQHCWTEVDGQIIDLTATQFGIRRKLYLPNEFEAKRFTVKQADIDLEDLEEINWPVQQLPHWWILEELLDGLLRNL